MNLPDRITRKIEVDLATGCWNWTGGRMSNGYGSVNLTGPKRSVLAHRFVYEAYHGPVPEGMHLHHRCENPRCCSPDHLVPVTRKGHGAAHRERPDTCRHGHPFDEANTYRDRRGYRKCRVCHRIQEAARLHAAAARLGA